MAKTKPGIPNKKPTPTQKPAEKPYWKKTFYISLIGLTAILLISGYGTGFHSDEMDMNAYGKANWKYMSTWGKDSAYKHITLENGSKVPEVIKTYGGFFELVNCSVQNSMGPFFGGEYNTRHLLCQLMGMLAIWLAALMSVTLTGRYLFGLITMFLIYLTPTYFGHMLFNTKDIPFTLGYTLCLYGIILLLKQKKEFSLKPFIWISLGLTASIGTRVGGLLLLAYLAGVLGLFFYDRYKKKGVPLPLFRKQFICLTVSAIIGLSLAILTWPFVLSSPVEHLKYALDVAVKFPQRIPFVFEGKLIDSLSIPAYYLPKWMSLTIPVFILVAFFLSIPTLLFNFRKPEFRYYTVILIAVIFPIVYAIQSKAALYSAWRHLLFVYPVLVVFSGYVLLHIWRSLQYVYADFVLCGMCIICMLHPMYWSLKNHPFEYLYFNELSGGFAKNYDLYETDYWQLSSMQAVDWLYKNESLKKQENVRISSNSYSTVDYLVSHDFKDKKTKVSQVSYKARCLVDWNYLVLSNLFIEPYVMSNGFYPPPNTLHTIEIEGKILCAIVKDTLRNDYKAFLAVSQHDLLKADSLADLYLKTEPAYVKMLEISASVKAELRNWPACYQRCALGLQYEPDNLVLHYYLGIYYAYNGDLKKAITNIEGALELGYQKSKSAYQILSNLYLRLGEKDAAKYYEDLAAKQPK